MYHHLWTNAPKECYELPVYTFKDHFKEKASFASFPPREVFYDYIAGRAKYNNAKDWIHFNTVCRNLSYEPRAEKFELTTFDHKKKQTALNFYDNVVVATGHFWSPIMPHYPGFDKFEGRVMHAHDFKNAEETANQTVLVVGTSYSADDIGL